MRGFRSVDQWKSALMALPESSFFELLRSVLGNIKTPFSKQRLMNDLAALLSKPEIQKVIKVYIDSIDHKIIAAVALLGEPVAEDLESFFAGEITGAELHALLINLEERFILFRYKQDETLKLALNPVLEAVLAPFIADTSPLFSTSIVPTDENTVTIDNKIPDGRLMAALFTFLRESEEVFITDRGAIPAEFPKIRRKVLDYGKKKLIGMDLELALKILFRLELCKLKGDHIVLNKEKIIEYANLSLVERQNYWVAAMLLCTEKNGSFFDEDVFYRRRLRFIASMIQFYRTLVEPGRGYPKMTLRRLGELIKIDNQTDNRDSSFSLEDILAVMENAGLMRKADTVWVASPELNADKTDSPMIVMDSAFSIILMPEISLTDAFLLGAFCSVKEGTQDSVKFELSRSSAVRGFDQGIEADTMLELLERLSASRLDTNIGWTIKEWENRYTEVSLYQGIVLTLAEEHRYLAEAGPVSSLIRKTLVPGVYLLSSTERTEAVKALQKAGIDIVAQPPPVVDTNRKGRSDVTNTFSRTYTRDSFPRLENASAYLSKALQSAESTGITESEENAESISVRDDFRKILDNMKLAKHERDELTARIDRRLVLSKTQLEAKSLKYEKLEAKGLDYAGKSLIAKQAIDAGSLVEATWPGTGGELNRIIGMPISLEKKEGDSILVCHTGEGQDDAARVLRIPLRKISLLRRIKKSLFKD